MNNMIEVNIYPYLEGKARIHHQYGNTHIISFLPDNYTADEEEKTKRWVEKVAAIAELGEDFFNEHYQEVKPPSL